MNNGQIKGRCYGISPAAFEKVLGRVCGGCGVSWQPGNDNKCLEFLLSGGTFDKRALLAEEVKKAFGQASVYIGNESALELAVSALKEGPLSVAGAESCTGGMVSGLLTSVAGSSDFFWGGWICYADEAKIRALGIAEEIIFRYGAVSEQTASAMAERARVLSGSSLAYSITGIAGPGGGTPEKPVGTVWMGLNGFGRTWTEKFLFEGGREKVRNQAAYTMLFKIYSFVKRWL
ncbi:MAG: CinA family protein [Spirochaetales bacterium]|nr:CinA family protein [Spirochaetales bacterium]